MFHYETIGGEQVIKGIQYTTGATVSTVLRRKSVPPIFLRRNQKLVLQNYTAIRTKPCCNSADINACGRLSSILRKKILLK